jgi:hypothetical protein
MENTGPGTLPGPISFLDGAPRRNIPSAPASRSNHASPLGSWRFLLCGIVRSPHRFAVSRNAVRGDLAEIAVRASTTMPPWASNSTSWRIWIPPCGIGGSNSRNRPWSLPRSAQDQLDLDPVMPC